MTVTHCPAATGRLRALTAMFAFLGVCLAPSPCRAQCLGVTELVSVTPAGAPANHGSRWPSLSDDGRFVAFDSDASDLVAGDTNEVRDVFVRDRLVGVTERVNVSSTGEQTNDASSRASISADGRFVAFDSDASNLVPGDTNNIRDVFVRDRLLGTTERVSVSNDGDQGDAESRGASISADGRYVGFSSRATNLVPGDTNNTQDVFVRDLLERTTERVSVSSTGEPGNGLSGGAISADARFVVFVSGATNLVQADTNGKLDIFVHDRETGETTRVSVASDGTQSNDDSFLPAISGDGRYVAFWSLATNLVQLPPMFPLPVLLGNDRATGQTTILGEPGYTTGRIALSADGRYVAYDFWGWRCSYRQCYLDYYAVRVVDRTAGHSCDVGSGGGESPSLSADGRFVAFDSGASGAQANVFILDRLPDTTPPETETVSGPCGGTAHCPSVLIWWRGTDPPVEGKVGPVAFAWRLDAGAWSAWTTGTSVTLTGLSDGAHVFEVKARDLAGNEDPTPARCEFAVVLSPPTVSITSPANGATVRGTVTITATVSPTSSSPLRGGGLRWGGTRPAPFVTPALPLPHLRGREAAGTAALQADGTERVEFYVNGQLLCTDTTAPYSCAWNTTGCRGARPCAPTNGPAQVCAKAFDRCGRSAQHCITVNVRNQTFGDVPPDNPAFPYIEATAARGITSGCMPAQGSAGLPFFCPYASATKAQVAVFVCRAAGKTWLDRPTPTFADVPKDNPYYGWIERLCDPASWGGTAPGTPCAIFGGKKFCPTASVSRQEIAWILCRATGKAALDRPAATFADVPTTNPYRGWIERLADPASWPGGIAVTNGCACPSTYPQPAKCYCPKSPLTRAQIAVFLVRAFGLQL